MRMTRRRSSLSDVRQPRPNRHIAVCLSLPGTRDEIIPPWGALGERDCAIDASQVTAGVFPPAGIPLPAVCIPCHVAVCRAAFRVLRRRGSVTVADRNARHPGDGRCCGSRSACRHPSADANGHANALVHTHAEPGINCCSHSQSYHHADADPTACTAEGGANRRHDAQQRQRVRVRPDGRRQSLLLGQ